MQLLDVFVYALTLISSSPTYIQTCILACVNTVTVREYSRALLSSLSCSTSLPVQWVGFSDPQTYVTDFWWCLEHAPHTCDVIADTHAQLSRGTQRSGLSLPVATPLYVTVRARNAAGLETISVSPSFQGRDSGNVPLEGSDNDTVPHNFQ